MFTARYEKNGPASEVFILGDVETPHPAAGQVRVKIAFSGRKLTHTGEWK